MATSAGCSAGAGLVSGAAVTAGTPGQHSPAAPVAGPGTTAVSGSNTPWAGLSAAERRVLQPLQGQWANIDDTGRAKWLNLAERYPRLSAAEQQRMQERMKQWANLPPSERGEARLRFQQTRQLSPSERQEKWAAYQALPATDRDDLSRQAQRKAKPVFLPDNVPGPREAGQVYGAKRQAQNSNDRKVNVVPGTATQVPPTVVAPALVKGGPGATTNLVTQAPSPALHQHTGLTKITASKAFVDPVTLLPRKGAQSAAMQAPAQKVSAESDTD
ncbi:DUF3106 domain-containing protein [Aquabacterium sp.]|uniref:DUF3106 domain-containing protein n=1 Tax=Aquabacterium sp. TaxID=1872578 RepID=UPI0025B7EC8E|nr:DUF3106 domain-containing protein [Aquabacterium sp.]